MRILIFGVGVIGSLYGTMVRVEITDLTKPQQNQVFTAPARILAPWTTRKL